MKLFNRAVLCFISMLFFLSGCHSTLYNKTEDNVADVKERITVAVKSEANATKVQPALVVNQGLYVDRTPVSLAKEPSWLKNRIVIQGDDLPFSYYSRTIGAGGGPHVLARYQTGLNSTAKLSVSYSGTVKGALDLLAAKTGYSYTINGNDVYWQAFLTKTFDVAFMPGTSDYMMGKTSGSSSGAVPQGGGSATSATGFLDDSSASQYSSLGGKISVWDDLKNTIGHLLSPDGKVVVSQATTSVTVRDRASNIALIGQYIKNMNKSLSAQVLVKIQVLEIALTDDFNYGINWNIVQTALNGTKYALQANYGTPVAITSLTGTTSPTIGFPSPDAGIGATGSWFSAVVTALQQQGRVSVVSEPRVVCLNNQVSAVRLVTQEGYLASIQITSFGGTGSTTSGSNANQVTSQLTPGTLITGLTLYILPKILGNKVYLQVNADLSNNQGFAKISSSQDPNSAGAQSIQVPNVSQKQFNQRSMIASGDTLILSGFRKVTNQTGAMQLFNSQSLGGKASKQVNGETIVLITPIILRGAA